MVPECLSLQEYSDVASLPGSIWIGREESQLSSFLRLIQPALAGETKGEENKGKGDQEGSAGSVEDGSW